MSTLTSPATATKRRTVVNAGALVLALTAVVFTSSMATAPAAPAAAPSNGTQGSTWQGESANGSGTNGSTWQGERQNGTGTNGSTWQGQSPSGNYAAGSSSQGSTWQGAGGA